MSEGLTETVALTLSERDCPHLKHGGARLCRACYRQAMADRHRPEGVWRRFWRYVSVESFQGCWEWTGAKLGGYGRFTAAQRRSSYAHRWLYEQIHGAVPDLDVDHLCRNKACVNPAHLEAVTHQVNNKRAYEGRPKPTHCRWGHAFTRKNLYVHPKGYYVCRDCADRARLRYLLKNYN